MRRPARSSWPRTSRPEVRAHHAHRHISHRRRIGLLLIVAGAVLAVACGPSPSVPVAEQATTPRRPEAARLPLDLYGFSVTDLGTLEQARARLTQECMQSLGFSWQPPPGAAEQAAFARAVQNRRYGVMDAAAVKRFGYHLPLRSRRTDSGPRPSADELAALDGTTATVAGRTVPAGGCSAKATRELSGGTEYSRSAVVTKLDVQTFGSALTDPALQAAFVKWSTCMASAGYRYKTPLESIADQRWSVAERPSAQEIRAATADLACKQRTNLLRSWHDAEVRRQQAAVAAHREELERSRSDRDRQLATAERLLSRR